MKNLSLEDVVEITKSAYDKYQEQTPSRLKSFSTTVNGITKYFAHRSITNPRPIRSTMFYDIFEFHDQFGLPPGEHPGDITPEVLNFRVGFMQEELDEFVKASRSFDRAGQLDALVDLVYVALGTAYLMCFPFNEAWDRVHAANMRKVRAQSADESKRGSAFDVVKPAGWVGPNHDDLVTSSGRAAKQRLENDVSKGVLK